MISKEIIVRYCATCGRANTDFYDIVFKINKVYDNKFLSDYGLLKYEKWSCFHCKKIVYFFRVVPLMIDTDVENWKDWRLFFYKFRLNLFKNFFDLFSNFNKINFDSLYIVDFSKIKVNLVIRKRINKINIISFFAVEKFKNSLEFIIKIYGPIKLTPGFVGVKDMFILKVFFKGKNPIKVELIELEIKFMWIIAFKCLFFKIKGYDDKEKKIDYLNVHNLPTRGPEKDYIDEMWLYYHLRNKVS